MEGTGIWWSGSGKEIGSTLVVATELSPPSYTQPQGMGPCGSTPTIWFVQVRVDPMSWRLTLHGL